MLAVSWIFECYKRYPRGESSGYRIPGTQVKAGVWLGINSVVDIDNCDITPPVALVGCKIDSNAKLVGPTLIPIA